MVNAEYRIGDLFIDSRVPYTRTIIVTGIDYWGENEIYYTVYISPDDKKDVWQSWSLAAFIDKGAYVYYPVNK